MADIKFTQLLPLDAGNVTKDTIFPVVENGFNWQLSTANLQPYVMNYPQGNLTANNIVGNTFTFANGVPVSNYSNANVQAYLPIYTGNLVNLQGNVITTANVQAQSISLSGNPTSITATGSITTTGNITTTANVRANNLSLTANAAVTGNVQASYFLGNGFYLSGVVNSNAAYGNSNVSTYLASGTDIANIITTGNVVGNNLITSGAGGNISGVNYYLGSQVQVTGNITTPGNISGNYLLGNAVTATGNISGNYYLGNGRFLTGMPELYGNSNVSNYLASNTNTANIDIQGQFVLRQYVEPVRDNAVAPGSNIYVRRQFGPVQTTTLVSNSTLLPPTAPGFMPGQNITLIIRQDSVGGWTLTYSSVYKFASGNKVIDPTPLSVSVITIFYDGTDYLCCLTSDYT